jgi:hypothetical protein
MSIFGNIVSAIFGHKATTTAATGSTKAPGTTAGSATSASVGATPGKPMTQQQVEEMIGKIAATQHEKFDWKMSIVDLMKLLNLDSSLSARKQLAQELGYKGELNGSAEMNIWLHKQVMTKLAESGGVVPESLKHA